MSNAATATASNITIVRTVDRVANHATGETHPRHDVKAACTCPACGDHATHAGTSYRGSVTMACGWCGTSFAL